MNRKLVQLGQSLAVTLPVELATPADLEEITMATAQGLDIESLTVWFGQRSRPMDG